MSIAPESPFGMVQAKRLDMRRERVHSGDDDVSDLQARVMALRRQETHQA